MPVWYVNISPIELSSLIWGHLFFNLSGLRPKECQTSLLEKICLQVHCNPQQASSRNAVFSSTIEGSTIEPPKRSFEACAPAYLAFATTMPRYLWHVKVIFHDYASVFDHHHPAKYFSKHHSSLLNHLLLSFN